MGIRVFVFDEHAALAQADYCNWIEREIKSAPKDNWQKPESSSPRLRKWFDDMRRSFPLIGDAHPDDAYGTEYCFYWNVIDVMFAGSIGEEGVLKAWRLAGKHGLRLLVGDELLPRKAPKGKRDFHISVLDGARPIPGIAPNMCFVVFDPEIAHISPGKARAWILERLEAEAWSKDQSILTGDKLRLWIDLFAARNLDPLVSEMRFYRDLIFIRVDRKNDISMLSPTMELSHKLGLPFQVYVDLG